jgi:hypothetical protein
LPQAIPLCLNDVIPLLQGFIPIAQTENETSIGFINKQSRACKDIYVNRFSFGCRRSKKNLSPVAQSRLPTFQYLVCILPMKISPLCALQ